MTLAVSNTNNSNYQDLLKTVAIICVIIDHIGYFFYPDIFEFRVIGRVAMPLFCFFAGYNFCGKPRYRLLIWGGGLFIYTVMLFKQYVAGSILIPIYLGQWYIYLFRNKIHNLFYHGYCHVLVLATLWYWTQFVGDYGTMTVSIMVLGYIAKHDAPNFQLCSLITIIIALFHVISVFGAYLSVTQMVTVVLLLIVTYILMIAMKLDRRIRINLRWIGRNTLYIYVIHLAIFEYMYVQRFAY